MIDIRHKSARKKALPRTGNVLDAVGGNMTSSHTGGGTSSGGDVTVNIGISQGDGISVSKAGYQYTISHGNTTDAESAVKESKKAIAGIELDDFGHLTGIERCDILDRDDLDELNGMYLRKDIPDTALDVITFDKRIGSTVFLDGFDGKGWEIKETGAAFFGSIKARGDILAAGKLGSPSFTSGFAGWGVEIDIPTATAEMDNIFIRKTFTAHEIVYSQIYGIGGSQIVSDLNKIARVEVMPDRYRCYMDDMDGLMLMNLRKGDGVRVQARTGTTGIKYLMGRCVGVDSDYFDMAIPLLDGTGQPEAGDFAMRWGNNEDTDRQGLIYLTTSDHGAPFIDVYDGITGISTEGKLKARLGNLKGIRTSDGRSLTGYGAYLNGVYVENSAIYTDTGETVEQRFVAMDGKLDSAIGGIRDAMAAESGNILRNPTFASDTDYWSSDPVVSMISVGGDYLWMDGSLYVEKNSVADIYRDGNRNALRILNGSISQRNEVMNDKEEGTHSFALKYRVTRAGTLKAGFEGSELFTEVSLTPSSGYAKLSKAGMWDGTGDFVMSFTGEILIQGVSLFYDKMADAIIDLDTRILQTNEQISLMAKKDYVDSITGEIYVHYDSKFRVTAEQISGVATRVDNINNRINTAGWITTADGNRLYANAETVSDLTGRVSTAESEISNTAYAITQKVSSTDFNGQTIISKVNQTASSYQIDAKNINLDGKVTFSMFDQSTRDGINGKLDGGVTESGDSLVGLAVKGHTIIEGGHIRADLIDAKTIRTQDLFSEMVTTGNLTVTDGAKIGILNIDTIKGVDGKPDVMHMFNDTMDINSSRIEFHSGDISAKYGIDSGPSVLGVPVPVWISNSRKGADTNYGIHVDVNGAYGHNIAISTAGEFAGLAFKTRRIDTNDTLDNTDVLISCYNKNGITILMPRTPATGKVFFIIDINGRGITINGNGKKIYTDKDYDSVPSLGTGQLNLMIYDGIRWSWNSLKW